VTSVPLATVLALGADPTSAHLTAAFPGILPRDFFHSSHVRRMATAGASPPLKP
jgi:hypothetical protein